MSMNTGNQVRVRFAPSPTGHLHIGGLRTALFNWLFARHHQGVFLLRIEDTDLERSKQEYTDSILESLNWCKVMPDEPIMIQSERVSEHRRLAELLLSEGKAYRCFCTSQEARERHATHHGAAEYSKYDRLCRDKVWTADDIKKPHAIRFKVPLHKGVVEFDDLIRGLISFDLDQLDDFIIVRSDGTPMYNFVVVVDDAVMRITHVIRGEDHISNTPKQILLYQALGYTLPAFAHLPMILGSTGERLSKRDGATSVIEYKRDGFLPDALCNYLVRLGWGHGDQEIFTRDEMVQYFSLSHVSKKGAIFDREKLLWVNSVYLRAVSDDGLLGMIMQAVDPDFKKKTPAWSDVQLLALIGLYKQRIHTIKELAQELLALYQGPVAYAAEDVAKWIKPDTADTLQHIITLFEHTHEWSHEHLAAVVKKYAQEQGLKLVDLAQPLRIALVGKGAGPGVFELLDILSKDVAIVRIKTFLGQTSK